MSDIPVTTPPVIETPPVTTDPTATPTTISPSSTGMATLVGVVESGDSFYLGYSDGTVVDSKGDDISPADSTKGPFIAFVKDRKRGAVFIGGTEKNFTITPLGVSMEEI